ncbi:MAG TPA: hypothetical protein VFJ58_24620 [Armatimonadota bacterium]|nr:hypothetical protein [Armatimonadota bacterium]
MESDNYMTKTRGVMGSGALARAMGTTEQQAPIGGSGGCAPAGLKRLQRVADALLLTVTEEAKLQPAKGPAGTSTPDSRRS